MTIYVSKKRWVCRSVDYHSVYVSFFEGVSYKNKSVEKNKKLFCERQSRSEKDYDRDRSRKHRIRADDLCIMVSYKVNNRAVNHRRDRCIDHIELHLSPLRYNR